MTVLLELLAILVVARALSVRAVHLGQPAAMGEIAAGIFLALLAGAFGERVPFVAGLLDGEVFEATATAGIFLLMLMAGVELNPRDIARNSKLSFVVALGGVTVPLAFGIGLGFAFLPAGEARFAQALLIGVALSITAIPASVRILADLGLMHTNLARLIVAAALYDDIIGLILLAVLTAVIQTGGTPDAWDLVLLVGKAALFFAVTVGLGVHVYPHVSRGLHTLQATALEFSALMAVSFGYGILAEVLGMHWILGPFMAALFFEPERVGIRAYEGIRLVVGSVTAGFFAPIFFASIGARIDPGAIAGVPVFLALIILAAFAGKLIGAGVPARLSGMPAREAMAVGVGMSSRGAVELIVISIAVESGIVVAGGGEGAGIRTDHLYSCLVLMAVVTTMLTPALLRLVLGPDRPPEGPAAPRPAPGAGEVPPPPKT